MGLYATAESDGITIDEFPLKRYMSFSLMDEDGDCFVAIDPLQIESRQKEKVVLAHELGHCETGSFYNQYAACDVRRKHESRADKWSIEHLVPETELNEAVAAGFTEIWQLAEFFEVPCDFMARAVHWHKYHNMDFGA